MPYLVRSKNHDHDVRDLGHPDRPMLKVTQKEWTPFVAMPAGMDMPEGLDVCHDRDLICKLVDDVSGYVSTPSSPGPRKLDPEAPSYVRVDENASSAKGTLASTVDPAKLDAVLDAAKTEEIVLADQVDPDEDGDEEAPAGDADKPKKRRRK